VLALAVAAALATKVGAAVSAAATPRQHDREPDLVAFVQAFDATWSAHDLEAVLACFAPDAVVALNYRGWNHPEEGNEDYRGAAGSLSLRAGVAVLMGAGVQLDLGGYQASPVVFGGAPATLVGWTYQRATPPPALPSALPPEVGADEVVLREGRILAYTRTPDGASQTARAQALDRSLNAQATRMTRSPATAAGPAPRAAEATDATWPLWLGGLGAAAALLVGRRRRHARRS
jgi:hypothetical protein